MERHENLSPCADTRSRHRSNLTVFLASHHGDLGLHLPPSQELSHTRVRCHRRTANLMYCCIIVVDFNLIWHDHK
jgi:hypothetical protein